MMLSPGGSDSVRDIKVFDLGITVKQLSEFGLTSDISEHGVAFPDLINERVEIYEEHLDQNFNLYYRLPNIYI